MNQTNHFFNLGYGWLCKHCSAQDAERRHHQPHHQKTGHSTLAFAQWADDDRRVLICPRCGVEEQLK